MDANDTADYYADVPNRVVALAVDAVLLTVLALVAAVAVSVAFGPAVRIDGSDVDVDRDVALVDAFVTTLLVAVYLVGSWVRLGGTPGQRLLGIRVVGEDGRRIGMRRAVLRWLLLAAPLGLAAVLTTALPLSGAGDAAVDLSVACWYLVLLVTTARSGVKRGLHDRWAETVVAKSARPVRWTGARDASPAA